MFGSWDCGLSACSFTWSGALEAGGHWAPGRPAQSGAGEVRHGEEAGSRGLPREGYFSVLGTSFTSAVFPSPRHTLHQPQIPTDRKKH